MPYVLDASVTVNWAMRDEDHPIADGAFRELATGSAVAPIIWWYEVRNILIMNERRNRISVSDSVQFLADLDQLQIRVDDRPDDALIVYLSRDFGLTVYDAAYLALAIREHLPIATLDRALQKAATSAGIPLLS